MEQIYPDAFYILAITLTAIVFGWKSALRVYRRIIIEDEKRAKALLDEASEIKAGADRKNQEVTELRARLLEKLGSVAHLRPEEVREELTQACEAEAKRRAARSLAQLETQLREDADQLSQRILASAIERAASRTLSIHTIHPVEVKSDEMKGRIIGKEGRNVRHFEDLTGVDVIVDETPGIVFLSAHNPMRRAIASIALEYLIADGRVNPVSIEQSVERARNEFDHRCFTKGREVANELAIGTLPEDLLRQIGLLEYSYNGSENLLSHSIDVAMISGLMAAELKLDPMVARRAGLLHDIGKVSQHLSAHPHAIAGADIARQAGENSEVINAIAAHHGSVEATSIYAILVQAANATVKSRPGAKRQHLEHFVKQVGDLEQLARQLPGVEVAYALQVGRELRVVVEGKALSDEDAALLLHDISKKVEQDGRYPGSLKITVIRESRHTAYTGERLA